MAFLTVITGSSRKQLVDVAHEEVLLGRDPQCAAIIDHRAASRRHAVIRRQGAGYTLQDLDSRNGTRCNGVNVEPGKPVRLRDNDLIQICGTVFRFRLGEPSSQDSKEKLDTGRLLASTEATDTRVTASTDAKWREQNAGVPPESRVVAELDTDADSTLRRVHQDAEAKLRALLQLGNEIGKLCQANVGIPEILRCLLDIFPTATHSFALLKQGEKTKLTAASRNDDCRLGSESSFDEQTATQVLDTGKAVLVSDEPKNIDEQGGIPPWSSLMCVPLISEVDDMLGVLQLVAADSTTAFSSDELDVLITVASLTSLGIENSSLHEQVLQQERLRALGQMASGAAHELNNALSPVLGYADLILHQPNLADNVREWIGWIRTGAQDATAIVEQLQYFYQQKHVGEHTEDVNLRELVERIPRLTQPRWSDEVRRSGHTIEVALELIAAPIVVGVESELRQVLTNLVFNAIDAIPGGGRVTLRLDATDTEAIIEVADTGSGMTEEQQHRCFEPFFTTKKTGSGLGLSVCLGSIKRHKGRIELTSAPGEGTTVRIILPRHDPLVSDHVDEQVGGTLLPSCRVLYIDDDRRLRAVVRTLLENLGQQVDVTEEASAGLARLKSGTYDVVITDLCMPGTDGRQVLRQVQELFPQIPVLMLTGWSALDALNGTARMEPSVHYISKPPTLKKLHSALREAVAAGRQPPRQPREASAPT